MPYIFDLIERELGGDFTRVKELFFNQSLFEELVQNNEGDQYYNFTPKTFDGIYFIKEGNGYTFYYQERARKSDYNTFDTLEEGVDYFLLKTKLAEHTYQFEKEGQKKWWQFWR